MASDDTSPELTPPEKPKGISRKKKSPSQTEVLERAYAVEKYPSEATRLNLGKELDLSEKQLQIWFTHRRYKDRRDGIDDDKLTFYAKNKSDIPSEEHRFTKRVEIDPNSRENDDSEDDGYPARVLAEERDDEELIAEHSNGIDVGNGSYGDIDQIKPGPKKYGGYGDMDQIKPGPKKNGGYGDTDQSKPGPKRKSGPRAPKDPNRPPRRPGPKPKFNALAAAERAAIAAVESQLCGPLREDGPPLGFEFDPLPPDAFQQLAITEVPLTAGGSGEGGSENYNARTALESKWVNENPILEKKKEKKWPSQAK